jgi:hypothetical protein
MCAGTDGGGGRTGEAAAEGRLTTANTRLRASLETVTADDHSPYTFR